MGAATRERSGRTGRRASGSSRRQRSNEPPASASARPSGSAAPDARTAPAATTLRSISRSDRVRPVLRQLVLVEAGLAVAAVGAALGGAWLIPSLAVLCLLVAIAVVRRRGRALQDWASTALGLRARRRAAAVPPPGDTEPMLAPVAENVPGFGPRVYVDRVHRTVGMLGDGTFLTAVVRVQARRRVPAARVRGPVAPAVAAGRRPSGGRHHPGVGAVGAAGAVRSGPAPSAAVGGAALVRAVAGPDGCPWRCG